MTDRNPLTKERREEITKAREAATPGPWIALTDSVRFGYGHNEWVCQLYDAGYGQATDFENAENNAHLIANAPEWLQQYEDTVQTLETEIERLKGINGEIAKISEKRHWERERYFEALTIAVGALKRITNTIEDSPVKVYQKMEQIAAEAIDRINKLKP